MKIITGRNVIYQNDKHSSACGCSGFDAETSDASGKKKKGGGDILGKAQGLFQKGKGFLDNNQGIKDTLGGILGGKKPSNDVAPTQTYNVPTPGPEPKKGMSTGVKIGIGVAATALAATLIYFAVKGKGKNK